jgi:hypothetical protein
VLKEVRALAKQFGYSLKTWSISLLIRRQAKRSPPLPFFWADMTGEAHSDSCLMR